MARYAFGGDSLLVDTAEGPLARQHIRDVADAVDEFQGLQEPEEVEVRKSRRWKYRRAPIHWPCALNERYCPHAVACASVVSYGTRRR